MKVELDNVQAQHAVGEETSMSHPPWSINCCSCFLSPELTAFLLSSKPCNELML